MITDVYSYSPDKTYNIDEIIFINVTFNENVTVTGSPRLKLDTSSDDQNDRYAEYYISANNELTLRYVVQKGDTSSDLDYTDINALSGGTIKDLASPGNLADLALPQPKTTGSLSKNNNLIIDGLLKPILDSVLITNDKVEINFISAYGSTYGIEGHNILRNLNNGPSKIFHKSLNELQCINDNYCKFTDAEKNIIKNKAPVSYELFAYNNHGNGSKLSVGNIKKPAISSFKINNGNEITKTNTVRLNLQATYAYQCRYANSQAELSTSSYENYQTTKSWTLPDFVGEKTVYVQCRNLFGETSSNDKILYQNKGENDFTNGCNNYPIDDDNDGVNDKLDKDCPPKGNNVLIETINLNDKKPFEDSEFEVQCKIKINGQAELNDAKNCIFVNLTNIKTQNSELCEFNKRNKDILRFNCNSGSLSEDKVKEDRLVSCHVNTEKCYGDPSATLNDQKGNLRQTYINITAPELCDKIVGKSRLSINEINLNNEEDEEYEFDDKIKADLDIENLDEEDLEITAEAYLYDINSKDEVLTISQDKEVNKGENEEFNLELITPAVEESKYKIYFKVYLKDDEDEICLQESKNIKIKPSSKENDLGILTETEISKKLEKDEKITFTILNEEHSMEVLEITSNKVKIKISSTPQELTLSEGESNEIDLNDDSVNDLIITLNEIKDGKADLSFKSIQTTTEEPEACTNGETRECGLDIGICKKGTQTCNNNLWGTCTGEIKPVQEICDDLLDNNCNGLADCSDSACSDSPDCGIIQEVKDSDNDGLPDDWEIRYFGNIQVQSGENDFDKDGFTNVQEYSKDTDPTSSSSIPEKKFDLTTIIIAVSVLIVAVFLIWLFVFKPRKPIPDNIPPYSSRTTYSGSAKANPALTNYIKNSLENGYTKQQIKNALIAKGWEEKDVENAFKSYK